MKTLTIGPLKLKNPIILSPMVDITDLPYRLICRKAGASLAYTEMLYIDAILHENKKTQGLLKTIPSDKPVGLQITGNSPNEFSKLIPYTKPFDLIDINCGCPSLRIAGNKAGSYLLKNPSKIAKMIRILKKSNKPVTAKIRLGYKSNNALSVSKKIEKAGADAITVHARLAIHGSSVPADWSQIKKIKKSLGIPVIGNGDILSPEKAAEMLDICDGAMIARGAIGDPYIFQRISKYLKTGRVPQFDQKKNLQAFLKYLDLAKKHDLIDLNRIRYLGTKFIKGFPNSAKTREKLVKLKSIKEIKSLIKNINL